MDGAGGVADGDVRKLPRVVAQLGEVVALRAEDLGKLADVELPGMTAGGGAAGSSRASASSRNSRWFAAASRAM